MIYDILKDFKGSQTGSITEQFIAGTQRDLSDYLAPIVVAQGWARPVGVPVEIQPVADNSKVGTLHMKRK